MKSVTSVATLVASLATLLTVNAAAAQPSTDIGIDNFAYAPAEMTISAGSTITWTNLQTVPHTATSDTGAWDSDVLANGAKYQLTLNDAGDYAYHCDFHSDMHGVIHVLAQ